MRKGGDESSLPYDKTLWMCSLYSVFFSFSFSPLYFSLTKCPSFTPPVLKPLSRSMLPVQNIRGHVIPRHDRPTKKTMDLGSRVENACLSLRETCRTDSSSAPPQRYNRQMYQMKSST